MTIAVECPPPVLHMYRHMYVHMCMHVLYTCMHLTVHRVFARVVWGVARFVVVLLLVDDAGWTCMCGHGVRPSAPALRSIRGAGALGTSALRSEMCLEGAKESALVIHTVESRKAGKSEYVLSEVRAQRMFGWM